METSTVTPSFYYIFIIYFTYCNCVPSFTGKLWLVLLLGNYFNAASFIGGSYLAKYLTGKNQDEERKRHDLAIEKYNGDYNAWKEKIAAVDQWKQDRQEVQGEAASKLRSTDEAFRLYKEEHPDANLEEPVFSNYYKPSKDQRNGEIVFTGLTVAGLAYGVSKLV